MSTLKAHQWRYRERAEGIKRSLKITGPSVATPPPTPPIDKAKSLVWSPPVSVWAPLQPHGECALGGGGVTEFIWLLHLVNTMLNVSA